MSDGVVFWTIVGVWFTIGLVIPGGLAFLPVLRQRRRLQVQARDSVRRYSEAVRKREGRQ